jgi:hypothetical protein
MISDLVIRVDKYSAQPYWPEVQWILKLEQKAGCHPKHKPEKRKMLIEAYCEQNGITMEQVDKARAKIENDKWYRNDAGKIIIPRHQFSGCIVQSLGTHPLKSVISADQARSFIQVSDMVSDREKPDWVYGRYIKRPESNMRGYQENDVCTNVEFKGYVEYNSEIVSTDNVESLLIYAGKWIGIGGSRKMALGRFAVISFVERA